MPAFRAIEKLLLAAPAEARAMGPVTFELRCATDLAAHWIATGRRSKAVRLLVPIYQTFTEGFATRDLVVMRLRLSPRPVSKKRRSPPDRDSRDISLR
jgi:predicted ATPase